MTNSFIEQHVEKARQKYQPLFSTIEITQACNFACRHCYNFDRQDPVAKSPYASLMSDQEIIRSIEQLALAGALYLNLTGGEPLLHPSLNKFIEKAKLESFFVRLKTNASLVTEEKAKELYLSGLDAADISLYGAGQATYEHFTKRAQFEDTVRGIDALKKAGIDISVSLILHRFNAHEIEDMIQLCLDKEWPYLLTDEITDRYDQSQASSDNALTDDQYADLLTSKHRSVFECDNKERAVQCSCATTVCAIAANGDVYPCIGAPIKSGSIKEESFASIWEHSPQLNKIRSLKQGDFKDCQSCSYIESCTRSSGSAVINTGDYTGCDPFALQRAKVRHHFKTTKM
jgi:radical SAM protein with 4Fe4S-binding SPASM domain